MAGHGLCSIANCGKVVRARGWCGTHYQRWNKYGDPEKRHGLANGEAQRYFRQVVMTFEGDECLPWPFCRDQDGYGRLHLDRRTHNVNRLVCLGVNGDPPAPDYEAAHSCGNGHLGCVTKRHIRWATSAENKAERVWRSR